MTEKTIHINPDMTVLDIVSKYRETEAVFKKYNQKAGECICCQALFDTVQDVTRKYGLDLAKLIVALEDAIDSD